MIGVQVSNDLSKFLLKVRNQREKNEAFFINLQCLRKCVDSQVWNDFFFFNFEKALVQMATLHSMNPDQVCLQEQD